MEFLCSYVKFMDKINEYLMKFVAFLMAIIFSVLVVQVFYRFVINASLSWSEEVARYLTIWMVFTGIAICIRHQSLIAVEIVVQSVPAKVKKVMNIAVNAITLGFSIFLVIYGIEMILTSMHDISTALAMPMWIAYIIVPVGGFLSFLNALAVLVELITGRKGGMRDDSLFDSSAF